MDELDPSDPTRRLPVPDPAQIQVTMPPPPAMSITEQGPSTQTTRTKMDPRFDQGAAAEQAGVDSQIQAQQDLKALAEQKGAGNVDALNKDANLADANATALAQAQAAGRKKVEDRIAEWDRRIADRDKAAKPTSYFEDKGTMGTLFSHVLVGLSERSHRLAGGKAGESPLQVALDREIEADTKKKMMAYEASKDAVEGAKQGIDIASAGKADYLADVKGLQAAGIDVLIKKTKALAAKIGTQEALAKADEKIGKLEEKKGQLHADRYALAKTVVQSDSGKTNTTTNFAKTGGGDERKQGGVSDAEKRLAYQNSEDANRELAKLAKDSPHAIEQYQGAEREFVRRETFGHVPVLGPGVNSALSLATGATKDDWLRKMSPEARRVNDLVETIATARALAMGGVVNEADRVAVKAQLGILGKSPKELSATADEYAAQAAKKRATLESTVKFPNEGARDEAAGTNALQKLVMLTLKKGSAKADIDEAAKAAKAAGVSERIVDDFVKKAGK